MLVNVVMRLENTYGRLLDDAADDFQSVTAAHLVQEIQKSVRPDGLVKLGTVNCVIFGQTVVFPTPPSSATSGGSNNRRQLGGSGAVSHAISNDDPRGLRHLQDQTTQTQQPLRVGFHNSSSK